MSAVKAAHRAMRGQKPHGISGYEAKAAPQPGGLEVGAAKHMDTPCELPPVPLWRRLIAFAKELHR